MVTSEPNPASAAKNSLESVKEESGKEDLSDDEDSNDDMNYSGFEVTY